MSDLPPQPVYVLRGHVAQIHSTGFIRSNSRLVTGDADGWLVVWSLAIKRPVAVWRAHTGSILGTAAWGSDKLISHGKDNKLVVWKIPQEDEMTMSTVLPVESLVETRKEPWIAHILTVNTMNFCSFSMCKPYCVAERATDELLIAVPNIISSESVDIFQLPSEDRIHTVPAFKSVKCGMVMAIKMLYLDSVLTVFAGYENGYTIVSQLLLGTWSNVYVANPHSQPILSLDVSVTKKFYLTSSADAIIAKHPIPDGLDFKAQPKFGLGACSTNDENAALASIPLLVKQTKHSGQQSLCVRSDGKICATAGWDSKIRVYSTKSLDELAVLKWHKEGCYAVAFASTDTTDDGPAKSELKENEKTLVRRTMTMSVQEKRSRKAQATHWLAAGSKDGKISLWEIY